MSHPPLQALYPTYSLAARISCEQLHSFTVSGTTHYQVKWTYPPSFFPGNIPAYFSFLLKNSSCPVCLSPPPIWCPPHPKTVPLCNVSSTGAPAQASWTLSCLDSRHVLAGQLRVLAGQAAENDYVPQFRHPHCSGGLCAQWDRP